MNDPITELSIVRKSVDHVSCKLSGETVMLQMRSGIYYAADEIGSRIWSLLDEPRTVGEIQKAILAEYCVDPERCGHDLMQFVEKLESAGLIEVRNEPEAQ
jgi:hypothetical protein